MTRRRGVSPAAIENESGQPSARSSTGVRPASSGSVRSPRIGPQTAQNLLRFGVQAHEYDLQTVCPVASGSVALPAAGPVGTSAMNISVDVLTNAHLRIINVRIPRRHAVHDFVIRPTG